MSFHRLNQYKEKKTIPNLTNSSNTPPANTTKSTKSTNKSATDRPLPRTSPPGNFNVNYDTLEIRIPNYTFGKAIELAGAGGLIAVSLGKRNKDNKIVLAKVSPHSVRLEREFYVSKRLHALPGGEKYVTNAVEYVSLVQDGLAAIIYADINPTDYLYFYQDQTMNYYTLYSLSQRTNNVSIWKHHPSTSIPPCNQITLDRFLNFAIECCSSLQFLHENGVIHGELRPCAFQCGYTADGNLEAKIWNFGGGLNSYEELLLTSSRWRSFMATTDTCTNSTTLIPTPPPLPPLPVSSRHNPHRLKEESNYFTELDAQPLKKPSASRFYSPKEFQSSLVYVSPEQTGRTSNALDHRADLYSLGIMFFVILTDRPPFDGTAMDVVHSILSKNVPLVHTIRKDIPPIISSVIDKLTRKTVDERYDSAYGLREDLLECKKRVAALSPDESLVFFPLGMRDVNPVFKVSDGIYGRNKETELISSIIESTYNTHQAEKLKSKDSDTGQQDANTQTIESSLLKEADNLLRVNSSTSLEPSCCEVIVLKGPGGIGKSTLVSTVNVQARHCGYTACAKFDKNQKRPYNGLLRCLSSILRQLLTESEHVVREFYKDLKENLGPQFTNVRLMVNMVPELRPILYDYREKINVPDDDALSTILNTETRFHAVFLNIIRCIARKKMITLCLDDLQEADEPSIYLISALISSRTTMLVILTFRDGDETPKRATEILDKCTNPVTTITLHPLGNEVLKELVLNTFYNNHRSAAAIQYDLKEQQQQRLNVIQPLVDIIYTWTRGNPFYAKQFLKTMKRKEDIWFDWSQKHWKFRLDNITKLFDNTHQRHIGKKLSHDIIMLTANLDHASAKTSQELFDVRNLVSHLRSLDLSAQYFLMWASLIGHMFNFRRIKWLMMATTTGGDTSSDENSSTASNTSTKQQLSDTTAVCQHSTHLSVLEEEKRSNQAILGLQVALNEGIIQFKSGNDFHFIHDRYYQAASMLIVDASQRESMHLKIGQMLMMEGEVEEDDNVFLIADHFVKSAGLIRLLEKTKPYRDILIRAGNEATLSGALKISAGYYDCAVSLLHPDLEKRWKDDGHDTFSAETLNLYMKILELNWVKNAEDDGHDERNLSLETQESMMHQIMLHTHDHPAERAQAWRIQARIYFQQSQYRKGIDNILQGLQELGIVVDLNITDEEVLEYYHAIKLSISVPGFDILSKLGPCQNMKQLAIMTLLNEACIGAYWVNPILVDFFAIKLCELSLKYGYTPASGGGFIWVGCTATRVSEFKFAAELGQFGVAISEKFAGNSEIARAIIVHHSMLAQWTGVHVREYIYQYQRAYKYALAGGDTLFSSMALFHVATTLYWTSCNLSELHWHLNHSMEECDKGSSKDVLILNISLWRSVLVFQGKTNATDDPEKLMNDPDSNFDEPSFVEDLKSQSVNSGNPLNWHYSFKMILLFHFGFTQAASELGFKIFDNSVNEAVHRHVGIAMYYHCIAVVESLRDPDLDPETREKYTRQLEKNRQRLIELADHSEVNYRMYQKVVEAQVSTLENDMPRTLLLYDQVIELALKGNWYSFSGLTFELAAQYYIRSGLTMLAAPLLSRSIEFYARWGAFGKVEYLKKKYHVELSKQSVSGREDVSVQTEDVIVGTTTTVIDKSMNIWDTNSSDGTTPDSSLKELYNNDNAPNPNTSAVTQENTTEQHENTLFSLDMVDLTSIIKSSQVISNEMNSFDELLRKMIGIIMTNSGAESGAIIIKEGFFGIAAYSVRSTEPTCQTYEPPIPLRDDDDKITTSIVYYVIHTHANLFIPNVEADSRFATGEGGRKKCAVICMPIMHKNTIVGVLYLQASLNTFTDKHANVLALLCDQIGISVTNALLFKSVQKATKANALMIESQLKALEEARASREQALRATKMKSNFLANMSHELRTPFSGFYGTISLLSETRLDAEQREFVSIAKQSCEMLLHIIDDLLDFSKLEAHKVKLHHGLFYVEDLIADRMELLITLATTKNVELSYFIDDNVPSIVYGDGNRIGQILMNLIGNAIKFTHHGEVVVRCGVDTGAEDPDYITLKISVQDTGIGMAEDEIKGLFLPFSQVDGSTTRNFGGTGLGLSICLQLVRLMHGDIQVESTVDVGSTFTFKIRIKNGATVADPEAAVDPRESSLIELTSQLGQPRILMVCLDRVKSMIEAFVPCIKYVEHRANIEDAIALAITNGNNRIPFDCVILDSPLPDTTVKLISAIEKNTQLRNTRILLLIAPTVDNIRRHFANSGVTNNVEAAHQYHIFHPLVTRLSKPVRRIKLLNTLVKVISEPVAEYTLLPSKSVDILSSRSSDCIPLQNESKSTEAGLVTGIASFSTQNQQGFSPEELTIFKGQKILVAEDNFIAQRLIVKQLMKLGFVVDKCNNGFECFDTWKEKGPGYYILAWIDHHMPGCDGLEATRKIRRYEKEMNYLTALPIIALTADIQLTAQTNCLNAGMNDYVTKPLMQKELATVLRKYCLGPTTI